MGWRRLAQFWIRARLLSVFIVVAVLAAGGFTYARLIARDSLPELTFPIVLVTVAHGEPDPGVADREVTSELHRLLAEVDGVQQTDSTTATAVATSVVTAASGTDLGVLVQNIEDVIPAAWSASVDGFSSDTLGFDLSLTSDILTDDGLDALTSELATRLEAAADIQAASPQLSFDADSGARLAYDAIIRVGDDGSTTVQPAARISLAKVGTIDSISFSEAVAAEIGALTASGAIPDHVAITTVGDTAGATLDQIARLESSLLQSLVIVGLMVLAFVGWRAAVVSVIFVPTVMAGTVLVLYLLGSTLNTISMFGLLLVLGLFIDDIVVIVEAIDRERQRGRRGLDAIIAALRRMGAPDVLGSLTTLAVFIPLLFIPGLIGDLVRQLPLAVIVALTLSVALALTAFLSLSSWLQDQPGLGLVDRMVGPITMVGSVALGAGRAAATAIVGRYLRSKILTTLAGVFGLLAIVIGMAAITGLGIEIFPEQRDQNRVGLTVRPDGGLDLGDEAAMIHAADQVAAAVVEEFGAGAVDQVAFSRADDRLATVEVIMTPGHGLGADDVDERANRAIETAPGLAPGDTDADAAATDPDAGGLDRLPIRAADSAELQALHAEVTAYLAGVPGVSGVVAVSPDHQISRKDSSPVLDVGMTLDHEVTDIDTVIEGMAEHGLGIGFTRADVATGSAIADDQADSFGSMGAIFLLSIMTIALLLAIQFRSILLPGLILLAIPLALPLLFPGLLTVGANLSLFTLLGISALIGISVNNSIMLIDYANDEVKVGTSPVEAILSALRVRFRPLVATTLTTIVGVGPLTADAQFSGLAWTLIFGLLSSTLLVILVFPAYYVMLQTPRSAVSRWSARRRRTRPVAPP